MEVLVVNQAEVAELLPMQDCMGVMAQALKSVTRGNAVLPLRTKTFLPDQHGALTVMPGYLGEPSAFGLKVISVFPGNHGTAFDSHQGTVLLFDTEHGQLLAIMDASAITAIRTAAVSGVATQVMARPDAARLAIIGAGVQARVHLEAMRLVRPIRHVAVYSRSREHAQAVVDLAAHYGIAGTVAEDGEAAVRDADIVCTTTSSRTPVLFGDWLPAGCHINAVGSSSAVARELDAKAVANSYLVVDRRESALNESGDFLSAKQDGAVDDQHIQAELGEVLLGNHPGRPDTERITLFKSLGIAIEDLASAQYIYQRALATGKGTRLEFGGNRFMG